MSFKKDYINYVLHSVIQSDTVFYNSNPHLKKLLEKIISYENFFKITYIVGRTAGLEIIFKYLLYISDKIDKSQVTIFNLKDNFEYDVNNLKKICSKVNIKQPAVPEAIPETIPETENAEVQEEIKDSIKIDVTENEDIAEDKESKAEEYNESDEETEKESDEGLTLVEQSAQQSGEEMFELDSINKSIESEEEDTEEQPAVITPEDSKQEDKDETETDDIIKETEDKPEPEYEEPAYEDTEETKEEKEAAEMDFTFEVRKPDYSDEQYQEEPASGSGSEIYNRFENKYYEEIKILEKLFSNLERDIQNNRLKEIDERAAKSFHEIIAISGGLSNTAKELSFDIISNIFYTINLFFRKSLKKESSLNIKNIQLLKDSLNVVHTLIKGGNYINYQEIVDNLDKLKDELEQPEQKTVITEIMRPQQDEKREEGIEEKIPEKKIEEEIEKVHKEEEKQVKPAASATRSERETADADSITFKMKYLVKEFEKQFTALENIKGEFSKFDALEKIDELNYYLRMIAKISAAVKLLDVLKLAEVSYVFLKYLKDYRMNLFDAEIKQIINYIIFTFKMLLTDRKPEDFNILVQYLNNPVKIFADSN
jgi:hypothetical protein